ncbi:MAG TPA: nuclear transport factor 2 family protein [Afipia sp.]
MSGNIEKILSTIQNYLDGLYEGDVNKLGHACNPICQLHTITDGKLTSLSLDDWLTLVEKRASPKSQNFTRANERIVSITVTAPDAANVTLNCAVPGRLFTDHLSMLLIDGRWQITNKAYHAVLF